MDLSEEETKNATEEIAKNCDSAGIGIEICAKRKVSFRHLYSVKGKLICSEW
jgi:hypothetical protein